MHIPQSESDARMHRTPKALCAKIAQRGDSVSRSLGSARASSRRLLLAIAALCPVAFALRLSRDGRRLDGSQAAVAVIFADLGGGADTYPAGTLVPVVSPRRSGVARHLPVSEARCNGFA